MTLSNPLPTTFTDEIINEFVRHELYSFIDGFLSYNKIPIAQEDPQKGTLMLYFGYFSYKICPFGLENAHVAIYIIMIRYFEENIYKSMVVYFNDSIFYDLLMNHIH